MNVKKLPYLNNHICLPENKRKNMMYMMKCSKITSNPIIVVFGCYSLDREKRAYHISFICNHVL